MQRTLSRVGFPEQLASCSGKNDWSNLLLPRADCSRGKQNTYFGKKASILQSQIRNEGWKCNKLTISWGKTCFKSIQWTRPLLGILTFSPRDCLRKSWWAQSSFGLQPCPGHHLDIPPVILPQFPEPFSEPSSSSHLSYQHHHWNQSDFLFSCLMSVPFIQSQGASRAMLPQKALEKNWLPPHFQPLQLRSLHALAHDSLLHLQRQQ